MEDTSGELDSSVRFWIAFLACLAIGTAILAWTVKGYHLFDSKVEEPFIQGADDSHYYVWLRSWVVDNDLSLDNDFRETPFLDPSAKLIKETEVSEATGLTKNKYPVGWAVSNFPAFWLYHNLLSLVGKSGDGFEPGYQIVIVVQQGLFGLLSLWLTFLFLRRWFSPEIAVLAIMVGWLCSPMIYYQTARVAMVHNCIYVLTIAIFYLSLKFRDFQKTGEHDSKKMAFISTSLGLLAGLLAITRPTAVIYLIPPIIVTLGTLWCFAKSKPSLVPTSISTALVGAFIGVFPQLFAWKIVYGSWIHYSYEGEGFNWGSPQWFQSLIGPHHGLFNWHPVIFIGLVSLLIFTVRRNFSFTWIIVFALIAWANSAWHMVHFGSAFGGRAYEWMVFYSIIGLGFLFKATLNQSVSRNLILAFFSLSAIWNVVFMYLFMQGLISRELPVTWAERLSAARALFF